MTQEIIALQNCAGYVIYLYIKTGVVLIALIGFYFISWKILKQLIKSEESY